MKRKAAAAGTSLEGYVRDLITRDAQDDRAALIEKLRALRDAQPPQTSDSTEYIRRWRDGGARRRLMVVVDASCAVTWFVPEAVGRWSACLRPSCSSSRPTC